MYDVIIDCYTDEPSGLGVPPYLGTYQRYLSQALNYNHVEHFYLTIDDLRFFYNGNQLSTQDVRETHNLTKNKNNVGSILSGARTIHLVTGCFVDYNYFSCYPPSEDELFHLIKDVNADIILYYVLGINNFLPPSFRSGNLYKKASKVVLGNPYNYIVNQKTDLFSPDYNLLSKVTCNKCPILDQMDKKYIIEIETGCGCSHARCSFCIEALRKTKIQFRSVKDILKEVKVLYEQGARHFRLGKQPNIYNYMNRNPLFMEQLLSGIREIGPDIITLHIDNVDPQDVVTKEGIEITKLIVKYCTSGNIANFGVESFDPIVRYKNHLNLDMETIIKAIEIINTYGSNIAKDGMHAFLPGINLLYGLSGQNSKTLEYNLKYLKQIFDSNFLTRRLFLRKVTNPHGNTFGSVKDSEDSFKYRETKINDNFVIPMQEKVYQRHNIIYGFEEILQIGGETYLRKLGTCPERFIVKDVLPTDKTYKLEVLETLGPRKLLGKVVSCS